MARASKCTNRAGMRLACECPCATAKFLDGLSDHTRHRTNPARARITVRSACAFALRCFTGHNGKLHMRISKPDIRRCEAGIFFNCLGKISDAPFEARLGACVIELKMPPNSSRKPPGR